MLDNKSSTELFDVLREWLEESLKNRDTSSDQIQGAYLSGKIDAFRACIGAIHALRIEQAHRESLEREVI